MGTKEFFEIGRVIKSKGLKGEISIHLDVDNPGKYVNIDALFIEEDGLKIPYIIEDLSIGHNNKGTVKLEDIEDKDTAEQLVNLSIFLPLEALPDLDEGKFYYHDVIGFKVVDDKLGELGEVTTFYSKPGQDLMEMSYQEKAVLIPVIDEMMGQVDFEKRQLHVHLPDGLIDIYLTDKNS